jgi:hypothetical protein
MASKVTSRVIVIDASIARSAGPENATHPTSKSCRDFLLSVLEVCHRAAFSKELKAEWRKHQSSFARQWMTSMFARKKIERIESKSDDKLRALIQEIDVESVREAMLKDVHLVEAANASDGIVASLDETVRTLLRTHAISIASIRATCWVNPTVEAEEAIEWLKAGAPSESNRQLGQ